ncbi:MAG: hypothetical protein ACR2NZ_20100 [Rubripirellula sp.]
MKRRDQDRELDSFNLLPATYQYQTRVRQLIRSWMGVLCILLAALGGVTIATLIERHRLKLTRQEIATTAAPLLKLRREVSLIQEDCDRRSRWCELSESSRPTDDLLQTLATIAETSETSSDTLLVDAVRIRMPVEVLSEQPPRQAEIVIEARADSDATDSWLHRLKQSQRVEAPSIEKQEQARQSLSGENFTKSPKQAFQLLAVPHASQVSP